MTQRSAVQIRPPNYEGPTAELSDVRRLHEVCSSPKTAWAFPLRRFWTVSGVMTIADPQGYHPSQLSGSTVNAW